MEKNVVFYYSKNGSNKYLANRLAEELECEVYPIRSRFNSFFYLAFTGLFNISTRVKNIDVNLMDYNNVIVCGPIWMGKLIAPVRGFIQRYNSEILKLYIASCCGSSDEGRDDKFGYAEAFDHTKVLRGDKFVEFEAFPIDMVIPEDLKGDDQAVMNTRLSDDTVNSRVVERVNHFKSLL